MQTASRQLSVRGLTTAWLEAPSTSENAPILMLLHGFPDAAESWSFQLEAFAGRCLVVAPFMRGAAPSAKGDRLERYGLDAVGLDMLAVLAEVDPTGRRPVVLVGHDLGAVHAWHLARLLQSRAIGLVIINGLTIPQMLKRLPRPHQFARSWYVWLMQVPLLPEVLLTAGAGPLVAYAHRRGGLAEGQRPTLASVRGALLGPLNQYRAFLREAPRRLRRQEARVRCPVLVLWGAADAFLLPPTGDELAADATDVVFRILPGNHWLHRSQPEQVNSLIGGMLDKLAAAGEKT